MGAWYGYYGIGGQPNTRVWGTARRRVLVTSLITLNGGTMSVLKVKVMRLDRNGIMRNYTMELKDTKNNNLEIEKLANMAESCYIDSKSK